MEASYRQKHFVLIHGACHGAWCWFKLKPRLESAGHRVTAIDLSASGTNMKNIQEVHTLRDYTSPLLQFLESIPAGEKVIIVGHSLGGLSLALAMEMFPEKVSIGVFVTAFMPDSLHPPLYVAEEFFERYPAESWLDTQFSHYGDADNPTTSVLFGPKFVSLKLYKYCSSEDIALVSMLMRTGTLFKKDLPEANKFSIQGYGSGKRIYVVCDEDLVIKEEFQRWMIGNNPVTEVKEIKGADHMPMLSKPEELCQCLLDIAAAYP